MTSIWDRSATIASNTATPPAGFPENEPASLVDDQFRSEMAYQTEFVHSILAGGTSDALTVTFTNVPASLTDGMEIHVRAAAANATTTPTLNVNSLGAKTITKCGGSALAVGDIVGNLHELILRYNLANTRWELLNPGLATGGSGGTFTGITLAGTTTLPGSGAISSGGLLGIGMTPVNVLDITQSQNAKSTISVLNATSGTAAAAALSMTAGTTNILARVQSQGYTPNAPRFLAGGVLFESDGVGGLQLSANGGNLDLLTNATLAGRIDGTTGGMTLGSPTGGQKGAGTLNTTGLYVNGIQVSNVFTKTPYVSAQQTITSAGALTLAHGLGVQPNLIQLKLHCLTAEYGYTIDQEIYLNLGSTDSSTANRGISVIADATNLTVRYSSQTTVFLYPHATTGADEALTNANWAAIFMAWA